jgi:hypothetical protein
MFRRRSGTAILKPRSHWKSNLLILALLGAGGAYAAKQVDAQGLLKPGAVPPPPARWVWVERPIEVFSLSSVQFDPAGFRYRAERHENGRGRRDILSYGDNTAGGAFLAIAVHRDTEAADDLADIATRLGGETVSATSAPAVLSSKFGPMDSAETSVAGRACIVFARYEKVASTAFEGLFCPPPDHVADRRTLTCAIDRLDLVGASTEQALRRTFVAAEARRDFCGAGQVSNTGVKQLWFDPGGKLPKLRS